MTKRDMTIDEVITKLRAAKEPSRELDEMFFGVTSLWGYPLIGSAIWAFRESGGAYTDDVRAALGEMPPGWRVSQIGEWDHALLRAEGSWFCIIAPVRATGLEVSNFHTRCDHAPTIGLAVAIAVLETIRWVRKQEQKA